MSAQSTTRPSRTVHQHMQSKLNLRPKLAPMTAERRERAKELPRLGQAAAPSNSSLMGEK